MLEYVQLLEKTVNYGEGISDRTGVGVKRLIAQNLTFDMSKGLFPLIDLRQMYIDTIMAETIGFVRGYTDNEDFKALGFKYWETNLNSPAWQEQAFLMGKKKSYLGEIYGAQWRRWQNGLQKIDQLTSVIEAIKTNPFSRRHIINTWNVGALDFMCLPPCITEMQFVVSADNETLDIIITQRSGDLVVGVPHDIAQAGLVLLLVGYLTGKTPGKIHMNIGDCHVYNNHLEDVERMLARYHSYEGEFKSAAEWSIINSNGTGGRSIEAYLDNVNFNWLKIHNYEHHGKVNFKVNN